MGFSGCFDWIWRLILLDVQDTGVQDTGVRAACWSLGGVIQSGSSWSSAY